MRSFLLGWVLLMKFLRKIQLYELTGAWQYAASRLLGGA
jgi:hypothetical protein